MKSPATPPRKSAAGDLPHAQLVTSQESWSRCLRHISEQPRLAMDLEANSLFAYREQVCLIQISTDYQDFIVDPLADFDFTVLGEIIGDPDVEKVFHAAEYDLILLKREFGWELENLFDTMWAARILGYPKFGLAALLDKFYGVRADKKHQKSNWCRRPLAPSQLRYAQIDTHYLLDLRDRLEEELIAGGHMAEAEESFEELTDVPPGRADFDPDGFWSLNGVRKMRPDQQAALKSLYAYRDRKAQRRNVPHFKIIGDRTLLALAYGMPGNFDELGAIQGMSGGQQRRFGRELLRIIEQSLEEPAPIQPPRSPRPPEDLLARYDTLHTWRKETARARGVESDVIASKDTLWAIARANPQTDSELNELDALGPWRYQTYAAGILAALREAKPNGRSRSHRRSS